MAFHIRNRETEQLARAVAREAGVGLTEAVHIALKAELEKRKGKQSLEERTRDLVDSVVARIKHPEPLPKSFYDDLYE